MDAGYFVYTDDESNLSETIMKADHVYNRIADEISKKIYINRLLYSMTLDLQYIRNIVTSTQTGRQFEHRLTELSSGPILVYGAGKRGKQLVELFPNMNWKGYIDKKQRGRIGNLEVKACEDYAGLGDSTIIISNQSGYKEIELELCRKGINENQIIVLEEWNKKASQNQYFETRCIKADKIENGFVDASSYDGTDSINFLNRVKKGSHKIWAFEPDNIQYEICKKKLSCMELAEIYNFALSDTPCGGGVIVSRHGGGTYISDMGISEEMGIRTVSLDEILMHEKIGYIKMDIEGYEKKALCGCANIIRTQKPALAICIYHKRSDIFEIPKLLLECNSEYQFAFGHYSVAQVDTVLYAF